MKYTPDYIKDKNVAVNCTTVEEVDAVQHILNPECIVHHLRNHIALSNFVYFFFHNEWRWEYFSNLMPDGYTIITATEFLKDWQEETKESPISSNKAPTKSIHVKPSFYAYMFEPLKDIAMKYGYNLVLHGSLARDMDLVAIPWAEELVGTVPEMIEEICEYVGGSVMSDDDRSKPHGRLVFVININREGKWVTDHFNECDRYSDAQYYLDISVTPVR